MRPIKAIVLLCALAVCAPAFGQTDKWREVDVSANPYSNYSAQQRSYLPVQDCHYVTEQYTVQVRDGRFESSCVAPCTQVVRDACGRPCSSRTTPGYCVRRWVPPQYETVRYRAYRSDLEIRTLGPDPCVTIGWAPSTQRDRAEFPTVYQYRYDPQIRGERTVRRNNRGGHVLSAVADKWR